MVFHSEMKRPGSEQLCAIRTAFQISSVGTVRLLKKHPLKTKLTRYQLSRTIRTGFYPFFNKLGTFFNVDFCIPQTSVSTWLSLPDMQTKTCDTESAEKL